MISKWIIITTVLITIFGLFRVSALAGSPKVNSFVLPNDIRVVSIHVGNSKNVSIFTFLPMGLAHDGPGQAQWSHLVEHLIIRSTIPADSPAANAETLPDHMRLDYYGTVDNWREGINHHLKWLKGIPFTVESLRAEKPKVISECDFTSQRLATHKFALAAWGQAYRHGQKSVTLKKDVTNAELSEIQRYRDEHLTILDKIVVCVVGGVDVNTIKPVVAEKLGGIKSGAQAAVPVALHPGDHDVIWDLDARHLVLTWPIPICKHRDYAYLMLASQWLMMRLFNDTDLKALTGMVLAGVDLTIPEGSFFYVSASVKPKAMFEDVSKKIEEQVKILRSGGAELAQIPMFGVQLSSQLTTLMDPSLIQAQAPPHVTASMIEGNLGLQWGMHEFRFGQNRPLLARRIGQATPEQVSQAARKYLIPDKRSTCTLKPE